MTEGYSFTNDVLFAFEQVALSAEEEISLTKEQKANLRKTPRAQKSARREAFLKQNEVDKKSQLLLKIKELETKVQDSDLPAEAKEKILSWTQEAKTHNITFFYDIQNKIKTVKAEVQSMREKEEAQKVEKQSPIATGVGMVVAGVALAPFVQVRFNQEDYDKRTVAFYEEKIINELVSGKVENFVPSPVYKQKKGSVYSQNHYQVKERQTQEIQNLVATQIQEKQKKAGIPVQTTEAIIENLTHMHPVKQRATQRAVYIEHPELEKKHKAEDKEVSSSEILRGIVRRQWQEQQQIIQSLQKEQAQLAKDAGKKSALRIKALDKKIADRQETRSQLGLFMEHFNAIMQANETTAADLIKAGTTHGQVLSGAIIDQITYLDMTGFQARTHQTTIKAKGISKRLTQYSSPIKAKAHPKKPKKVVSEKSVQKPKTTLTQEELKGISKRLKTLGQSPKSVSKTKKGLDQAKVLDIFERRIEREAG